ncbi:hypothetical protein B0H16DRAFT_1480337 [Mycena metata]|uniref:Uncharacterized protein n=1 Tax=Mycena metata TaxID=1033252 RepID=A0AAD7H3F2_9AGAR|nr:hypothetical protein B0H16DRAFT_1480337 [Mycena metata]
MCALILHVCVICTGLILLLAPPSWNGREVYFDPAISLVVARLFWGARFRWVSLRLFSLFRNSHSTPSECNLSRCLIPIPSRFLPSQDIPDANTPPFFPVHSASFVLLQGVPAMISLGPVRAAILVVQGVQSLHELHIWQAQDYSVLISTPPPPLSESKNIAFIHVLAARELDFMPITTPPTTRASTPAPSGPSTTAPPHSSSTPPAPHPLLCMLLIKMMGRVVLVLLGVVVVGGAGQIVCGGAAEGWPWPWVRTHHVWCCAHPRSAIREITIEAREDVYMY